MNDIIKICNPTVRFSKFKTEYKYKEKQKLC